MQPRSAMSILRKIWFIFASVLGFGIISGIIQVVYIKVYYTNSVCLKDKYWRALNTPFNPLGNADLYCSVAATENLIKCSLLWHITPPNFNNQKKETYNNKFLLRKTQRQSLPEHWSEPIYSINLTIGFTVCFTETLFRLMYSYWKCIHLWKCIFGSHYRHNPNSSNGCFTGGL